MKLHYKFIFLIFRLTGIFPHRRLRSIKDYKSVFCYIVTTIINIAIILIHVYLTILAVRNHKLYENPVANTATNIIKLINRCSILLKWKKFVKICYLTNSFGIGAGKKYNIYICVWVIITLAFAIPLGILDVRVMSAAGVPYIHYGIPSENTIMYNMAATMHTTYFYVFAKIPMDTFNLFYLIVCDHLRRVIKNFASSLDSKKKDYNSLLRNYVDIKSTINFIDGELSLFVFLNVILTSAVMYDTVSGLMHTDLAKNPVRTFQIQLFFVYILAYFLAVITAASLVSEASQEVRQRAQALPLDEANVFRQQKFQSCAESEIFLTVWKIVPIRRSFALGTIGAIFTYALLFDNLIGK
ncbi:hypothetical protein JTE90_011145 [Oedothorax gibbosus]|uniref:Gustatory receptor n=1 Tax=Oedothorax gibbosus TaxID=931172 RepID=A0AAV6U0D0_9ARAC|nr:hypothetical protein JTE90_011145 [Oedothorax gibbosus]